MTLTVGCCIAVFIMTACTASKPTAQASAPDEHDDRIRGMLIGSLIGDAAGGPVEFVTQDRIKNSNTPFRVWTPGEHLKPDQLDAYGDGLMLMDYSTFRPTSEPYAHWLHNAPPGTVTDDSRHKFILIDMIQQASQRATMHAPHTLTERSLADAYLRWEQQQSGTPTNSLNEEWLREYMKAARWVAGIRENAAPSSRLWGGLSTCAGQMTLPPLAGLFPGDPHAAYSAAYRIAFIDNAEARDLNAAIVAGLARAMTVNNGTTHHSHAWTTIKSAMIETDPWSYNDIPWVERSVPRWIRFAQDAAARSNNEPAQLRQILENELNAETWWEAHTTFAMAWAAMEFCDFHPAASMRLAIELGHDTDSTAQIVGMFMGALHGTDAFAPELIQPVLTRLRAEYGHSPDRWTDTLRHARGRLQ